jgi:hypothetical protein
MVAAPHRSSGVGAEQVRACRCWMGVRRGMTRMKRWSRDLVPCLWGTRDGGVGDLAEWTEVIGRGG